VACLAVLCVLPALHPGDIQWVGDEPTLIGGALRANGQHVLATHGISGSAGVTYGPFPTWVYQLYLVFSSDLVALVAIRAVLLTGTVALSLVWLCRTLSLWPWFIPALLCSPYLWFYGRAIWDVTFSIPLCAVAFASAVSFLARGRVWTLFLSLACCVALGLTHLMSVAFVVPLAGFLLLRSRGRLRALWWQLLLLAIGAVIVSFPYLAFLRRSVSTGAPLTHSLHDWLFPFLGGRSLSAQGIEDIFGAAWLAHDTTVWGRAAALAGALSILALPLVWGGLAIALAWVREGIRVPSPDLRRTRADAALLALLVVLAQVVLDGLTAKSGFTHFFNATWIVFALLAWLAVEALRVPPLRIALSGLLGASTLAVSLYLLVRIHHTGPARQPYGATLANQIEVARELNRRPPGSTLRTDVINVIRFPIALGVLRTLYPPTGAPLPPAALRLVYRTEDPVDGRIRLLAE
jgi:hypothetical protein